MPTQIEDLWKTGDVAKYLGVKPRTVHELRYSGRLPFIRLARNAVRFVPSDIRKAVEGWSVSGRDAA